MAYYRHITYKPDSPVQQPEQLFDHKKLMLIVLTVFLACTILLFVNLPDLRGLFNP